MASGARPQATLENLVDDGDQRADAAAGMQDDYPDEGTYDYFDGRTGAIYRGLPAAPTPDSYRLVDEDSEAQAALDAGELPLHGHADMDPHALAQLQQLQYEQPGRLFGRDQGGEMQDLADAGPDAAPPLYNYEADHGASGDRAVNQELNHRLLRGDTPSSIDGTMSDYMQQRTNGAPGPRSSAPAMPSIADAFEAGYSGKPIESIVGGGAQGDTATDAPDPAAAAPGQQTAQLGTAVRTAGRAVGQAVKDIPPTVNANPGLAGAWGESLMGSGAAGSVSDFVPEAAEIGAGLAYVGDPMAHKGSSNPDVELFRMLKPHLPDISPDGIQALRDAYPGATVEQLAKAALVHARSGVPLGMYKPPSEGKSKSDEVRSSPGISSKTGQRPRDMAPEPGDDTEPSLPAGLVPLGEALKKMRQPRAPKPGAMSAPTSVADTAPADDGLVPLEQALPMLRGAA